MDNSLLLFEQDLIDAEEVETNESPWYVAAGGKAILIITAVPVDGI